MGRGRATTRTVSRTVSWIRPSSLNCARSAIQIRLGGSGSATVKAAAEDWMTFNSSAKLRQSKPPRALILSTGEDIPRGQSVRARLMILELSKGAIKGSDLTECQTAAQAGLYADAMAGFVQWFAGQYEDVRAAFGRIVSEYRSARTVDFERFPHERSSPGIESLGLARAIIDVTERRRHGEQSLPESSPKALLGFLPEVKGGST